MDYHRRGRCSHLPTCRRRQCYQRATSTMGGSRLFITFLVLGASVVLLTLQSEVGAQDQNAPPILYVRERNWRISEIENVGQIIDRVRAEDPDGDNLLFGIEPRFLTPNNAANGGGGDSNSGKLPFRIDRETGVVYLNESLEGRAGENFLIYITVTDGQYTAKNEVFINILGRHDNNVNGFGSRSPPSISNVVQNISQFLPAFDQLPGVQSIRNGLPNRRPSFPGSGGGGGAIYPPFGNFYPNPTSPLQPQRPPPNVFNGNGNANGNGDDDDGDSGELGTSMPSVTSSSPTSSSSTTTTPRSRTKLTPISANTNVNANSKTKQVNRPSIDDGGATESISVFTIKSTMIPIIVGICGIFAAVAAIFGYLCRRRLCAFSRTLKKSSKEKEKELTKMSSPSLTDESRNSMVLQQWNGPIAYGNRYVPWERDQQLTMMATSQLSTSGTNGGNGSVATAGSTSQLGGIPTNGMGVYPGSGNGGIGIGISGATTASSPTATTTTTMAMMGGDRWEFPRHRLKFFNILGEGAFGQVWRCEATNIDGTEGVSTVAVKTLKESAAEIEKKDLLSELEVMKSLEPHVNVVRLLGCCTDKDPTFVIIEYVNRGKLQTYLRNSRAERHYGNTHGKSNILTSGDLTSFMYQVARGMDYLTSRGIIHRDLAARNILITDDHTCKVADFGFARDIITSKIYERKSEGKLPIRWMATESLYDNIFSVKSDIWSFGILMWEIVTLGSTPYPGISAPDVMRKVRDGYRLEKPEHCRRELYNIMYYCWSHDSNERPGFSEITQMLDKLLHTEMDYIELERFPDHNYYNIVNLSDEKL